jgi:hypothetical protein
MNNESKQQYVEEPRERDLVSAELALTYSKYIEPSLQ